MEGPRPPGSGRLPREERAGPGPGAGLPGPARWAAGLAAVLLFLGGVRLLGSSAARAAPWLQQNLPALIGGDLPALGAGWLASYATLNGSVVAAVAVSLFASATVATAPFLLVLAGSRLGSAAFVVVVGGVDHLRRGTGALRRSVGLGILAFVVTHTVYLPATALARVAMPAAGPAADLMRALRVELPGVAGVGGLAREVVARIGALPAFALALLLLVASIQVFDALLRRVDRERLRDVWLSRLGNRWVSLAAGMAVTLLGASVAFSVGIVVPLYNRGHVTRRQIVPYLLGANVTTLADTAAVAIFLDAPDALGIVALLLAAVALVSAAALAAYPAYYRLVDDVTEAVEGGRRGFALFVAALAVLPLLLVGLPLL